MRASRVPGGRLPDLSQQGFTLLEIMVVAAIVGILAGLAVLTVDRSPRSRLAEEGQRLAMWIEWQLQEALLRGETRGIRFTGQGYAILASDEDQNQWRAPTTTDAFTHRRLPEDLKLRLWVEQRPVPLSPMEVEIPPQVALFNTGESTDFVVVLSLIDDSPSTVPQYRVAVDALGRLTVEEVAP